MSAWQLVPGSSTSEVRYISSFSSKAFMVSCHLYVDRISTLPSIRQYTALDHTEQYAL